MARCSGTEDVVYVSRNLALLAMHGMVLRCSIAAPI